MAWKPPTRHLKKKELLCADHFFQLLSAESNFVDKRTVRDFYQALARVLTQELRTHKFVRLPMLGDMALVEQKARPAIVGKSRRQVRIAPRDVLKFYPKERWRRYFNAKQGDPILLGPAPVINSYYHNADVTQSSIENVDDYTSPFYRD